MSEIIFVKPKEGMTIMQPDFPHAVIPEGGRRVRRSPYWSRLIKQGAVTVEDESIAEVVETAEPIEEKPEVMKAEKRGAKW